MPDDTKPLTMTVPEAGKKYYDLSRDASYAAEIVPCGPDWKGMAARDLASRPPLSAYSSPALNAHFRDAESLAEHPV